jgi:GAF domain-containing protein
MWLYLDIVPYVSSQEEQGRLATMPWTAADFLLDGRYCEREDIAAAVSRLRILTKARMALLVAYRASTLFHTLLLIDDDDEERGQYYQAKLLAGERWRQPESIPLDGLAWDGTEARELLDRLKRHPPFEQIADALQGEIKILHRSRPGSGASVAAPPSASIHLLLFESRLNPPMSTLGPALDELHLMVSGSAAVVVHGNLKAEEIIDQALVRNSHPHDADDHPQGPLFDSGELNQVASSLLKKAIDLTGSRLGNVYLADRDGTHLQLIAYERNAKPRWKIEIEDRKSVVSWVFRRNRPMVINSIPDFLRDRPDGFIDVAGDLGTPLRELAVPIIQYFSAEGQDKVIGVINVEKFTEEDGHTNEVYSYRDVTVLRSVAQRIAMKRASSLVDQASVTLAGLMKRSTSAAEWRDDAPRDLDQQLPADAMVAKEIVVEALRGVHSLTQSFSASVRLLSPDRKFLVRFAAFPPERMDDPPMEIDIEDRESVTAWVAREGETCDLKNVRNREEFRRYLNLNKCYDAKRDTTAELCVPIVVNGRVVGVMNLESRIRDAYTDSVGIASAVAEQVGLAIQYARRFHEQAVLSMSTATTANVHELGKLSDRLRGTAESHDGPVADTLLGAAEDILRFSRSGADLQDLPPVSLKTLTEEVLDELRVTSVFEIYEQPPPSMVYTGADALTVRGALIALIDNANRKGDDDPGCGISWRTTLIGGKEYGTLLIANRIRMDLDPADLKDLFRRPLRGPHSSRVKLGAFTAGALIRSLGGDVFVEHSKRPYFIVGVDLPIDLCIEIDQPQEEADVSVSGIGR